mgnify:CR=1 FL=1
MSTKITVPDVLAAKRGRPVTKIFQAERTQEIYVVIDASRLSARPVEHEGITQTALERYLAAAMVLLASAAARAQDVPGIEICTVEKTMERRTSCLQSNVDFLHKTIDRMRLEQQQRLDAAKLQINALSSAVVALQKKLDDVRKSDQARTDRDLIAIAKVDGDEPVVEPRRFGRRPSPNRSTSTCCTRTPTSSP